MSNKYLVMGFPILVADVISLRDVALWPSSYNLVLLSGNSYVSGIESSIIMAVKIYYFYSQW